MFARLIVFALLVSPAAAERRGYSYLGLGPNLLDYDESVARVVGAARVEVETRPVVNIAQQSGAFVAIDDTWGFYLTTASTLGEAREEEVWRLAEDTVRTNRVAFDQARIDLTGAYQLGPRGALLFGVQYGNTEFRRFAVETDDPALFTAATETEDVVTLSLVAGAEWSSFFTSAQAGWRWQIQGVAGVPALTTLSNTTVSEGEVFMSGFNGFGARANLAAGYQFNAHLMLALQVESAFAWRQAKSRDEARTEFPENTQLYVFPNLAFYWSF